MSGQNLGRRGADLTRQITKVITSATYAEDGSIRIQWNSIMLQIARPTRELSIIILRIYVRHIASATKKRAANMLKWMNPLTITSRKNIGNKE